MTSWSPVAINGTNWGTNPTTVVYDESGKTYDTLATYYDGNELQGPVTAQWTPESINATTWS